MLRGLLILVLIINIFFISSAYAYLDPGTGSYILQLVVGLFFGFLFLLKTFWLKIKLFFTNLFKRRKNED